MFCWEFFFVGGGGVFVVVVVIGFLPVIMLSQCTRVLICVFTSQTILLHIEDL